MGRSKTIVRAATVFDDTGRDRQVSAFGKIPGEGHSGGWLFHCRINEHSHAGMASFIEIRELQVYSWAVDGARCPDRLTGRGCYASVSPCTGGDGGTSA